MLASLSSTRSLRFSGSCLNEMIQLATWVRTPHFQRLDVKAQLVFNAVVTPHTFNKFEFAARAKLSKSGITFELFMGAIGVK